VDAPAGQPPAEDDDLGWLGAQLVLVGAVIVAVLLASVLVALFVGRGPVLSSQAAGLAGILGVPDLNLQAFPVPPELGDPTPGISPPSPVIVVGSQGTSELSPQTIIDY
jgi:hypothetical protein